MLSPLLAFIPAGLRLHAREFISCDEVFVLENDLRPKLSSCDGPKSIKPSTHIIQHGMLLVSQPLPEPYACFGHPYNLKGERRR